MTDHLHVKAPRAITPADRALFAELGLIALHGPKSDATPQMQAIARFREDHSSDAQLKGALVAARAYVEEAVDADGGINSCEIHMRHDLEAIDRALADAGSPQPVKSETTHA